MSFPKRTRRSSRNRDEDESQTGEKHPENESRAHDKNSSAARSSKSAEKSKSKSKSRRTQEQPQPVAEPRQNIVKSKNISSTLINYELRFEDLGGLQEQIKEIKNSVIYKVENKKLLQKYGLNYRVGGILLEGPPGTGKTICAHTIAAELSRRTDLSYTFFTHNAVESMTKWLGESESNLRHLFRVATENAPSIIFFDEFDAICPRRDDKKSSTEHKTIVATLLSEFNKIQDEDSSLVVIGATNIVDNIDPAMLRSGRFDTILSFPLPADEQRMEIIRLKMKGFLMPEELTSWLTKETAGYSGAHLTYLCHEAQLNCFKRQIDVQGHSRGQKHHNHNLPPQLGMFVDSDFLPVIEKIKIFGNHPRRSPDQGPANMANVNQNNVLVYDALTEELSKSLADLVQSFIPRQGEVLSALLATSSLCFDVVNSFLLWSADSSAVLNKIVVPRILEILKLPAFKVSEGQLRKSLRKIKSLSPTASFPYTAAEADESDDENDPMPCICQLENERKRLLEAINDVVTEAGKVEGPAVLFIENIDGLFGHGHNEDRAELTQNLISSIKKNVLLLATASCDLSTLPSHAQPLFRRLSLLGCEKSTQLRLPTEREITKCLCQVSEKYIQPRINRLPQNVRSKLKISGEKEAVNWPRVLRDGFQMAAPSFGDVHRFRSEFILEFLTSSAEDFVTSSIESFKF